MKKLLGLISVLLLVLGFSSRTALKEIRQIWDGPDEAIPLDHSGEDGVKTRLVCRDLLEMDENAVIISKYAEFEVVDCLSIDCGTFF